MDFNLKKYIFEKDRSIIEGLLLINDLKSNLELYYNSTNNIYAFLNLDNVKMNKGFNISLNKKELIIDKIFFPPEFHFKINDPVNNKIDVWEIGLFIKAIFRKDSFFSKTSFDYFSELSFIKNLCLEKNHLKRICFDTFSKIFSEFVIKFIKNSIIDLYNFPNEELKMISLILVKIKVFIISNLSYKNQLKKIDNIEDKPLKIKKKFEFSDKNIIKIKKFIFDKKVALIYYTSYSLNIYNIHNGTKYLEFKNSLLNCKISCCSINKSIYNKKIYLTFSNGQIGILDGLQYYDFSINDKIDNLIVFGNKDKFFLHNNINKSLIIWDNQNFIETKLICQEIFKIKTFKHKNSLYKFTYLDKNKFVYFEYDKNNSSFKINHSYNNYFVTYLLNIEEKNLTLISTEEGKIIIYQNYLIFSQFIAHSSQINNICYLGEFNCNYYATCSNDSKIKVWSLEKNELIHEFIGHSSKVLKIKYMKFINLSLISSICQKSLKIWNLNKRCLVFNIMIENEIKDLILLEDSIPHSFSILNNYKSEFIVSIFEIDSDLKKYRDLNMNNKKPRKIDRNDQSKNDVSKYILNVIEVLNYKSEKNERNSLMSLINNGTNNIFGTVNQIVKSYLEGKISKENLISFLNQLSISSTFEEKPVKNTIINANEPFQYFSLDNDFNKKTNQSKIIYIHDEIKSRKVKYLNKNGIIKLEKFLCSKKVTKIDRFIILISLINIINRLYKENRSLMITNEILYFNNKSRRVFIIQTLSKKNNNNYFSDLIYETYYGQNTNEYFCKLSLLYAKDLVLFNRIPTIKLDIENHKFIKYNSLNFDFPINSMSLKENIKVIRLIKDFFHPYLSNFSNLRENEYFSVYKTISDFNHRYKFEVLSNTLKNLFVEEVKIIKQIGSQYTSSGFSGDKIQSYPFNIIVLINIKVGKEIYFRNGIMIDYKYIITSFESLKLNTQNGLIHLVNEKEMFVKLYNHGEYYAIKKFYYSSNENIYQNLIRKNKDFYFFSDTSFILNSCLNLLKSNIVFCELESQFEIDKSLDSSLAKVWQNLMQCPNNHIINKCKLISLLNNDKIFERFGLKIENQEKNSESIFLDNLINVERKNNCLSFIGHTLDFQIGSPIFSIKDEQYNLIGIYSSNLDSYPLIQNYLIKCNLEENIRFGFSFPLENLMFENDFIQNPNKLQTVEKNNGLMEYIITTINYLNSLDSLIVNTTGTDKQLESIIFKIDKAKNILDLKLDSNQFKDLQILKVVESIQNLTNLASLSITNNKLSINNAKSLSYSLQYLSCLENLNLEGCKICQEGMFFICITIRIMKGLKLLNLNKNIIDTNQFLLMSLENLYLLERLSLSNVGLGDEGAKIISTFLNKLKFLHFLDISHNKIKDIGLIDICNQFPFLLNIKELNISINGITENGARKLSETLHYLKNLTHLYINNNYLEDSGAISLSEVIPELDKLMYLFLDENNIGEEGENYIRNSVNANCYVGI